MTTKTETKKSAETSTKIAAKTSEKTSAKTEVEKIAKIAAAPRGVDQKIYEKSLRIIEAGAKKGFTDDIVRAELLTAGVEFKILVFIRAADAQKYLLVCQGGDVFLLRFPQGIETVF